ncbi:Uncharacterized protein TCM_005743 [Theobroma cacao]|uniref:Uncharacterized protein n=1 Tax=Theobroma cacao TaxID=3641 RepID=A0A061E2J7_THECC|nr:Uncharacterized protein TCM_005743 [Theobroma cacao]
MVFTHFVSMGEPKGQGIDLVNVLSSQIVQNQKGRYGSVSTLDHILQPIAIGLGVCTSFCSSLASHYKYLFDH